MHEDSEVVKVIRKEVSEKEYSKQYTELTSEEKTFVNANLYSV
jgi:hypothetical protein